MPTAVRLLPITTPTVRTGDVPAARPQSPSPSVPRAPSGPSGRRAADELPPAPPKSILLESPVGCWRCLRAARTCTWLESPRRAPVSCHRRTPGAPAHRDEVGQAGRDRETEPVVSVPCWRCLPARERGDGLRCMPVLTSEFLERSASCSAVSCLRFFWSLTAPAAIKRATTRGAATCAAAPRTARWSGMSPESAPRPVSE